METYFIRKIDKYDKLNNKYKYKYITKQGKPLSFNSVKNKINNIYIPPAYDNVKVNKNKNSKVLAIGYDTKGRPQYIYNNNYKEKSKNNKFLNLIQFGKDYPKIINKINKDLNSNNEKEKQIAIVLKIIIDCNFRIGNKKYTKKNNSFGVTTLRKKHIHIKDNQIIIDFVGKKGVRNKCTFKNKKVIRNIKKTSKSIRNNESIFMGIDSKDVNNYLKQFGNYTTKNFRTWNANIQLIQLLIQYNDLKECIEKVSKKLHHTPSICKKNYIDTNLINFFKSDPEKFKNYFATNTNEKFIKFLKKKY